MTRWERFKLGFAKWSKIILVTIAVLMLLGFGLFALIAGQGGAAGQYSVLKASAPDYISNVEYLPLGAHNIALRNIHDMGFCTRDPDIVVAANKLWDREINIVLEYRTINTADAPAFGCDPGTEDVFTIYLVTGLRPTTSGMAQNILIEQILGLPHDPFFDVKQ